MGLKLTHLDGSKTETVTGKKLKVTHWDGTKTKTNTLPWEVTKTNIGMELTYTLGLKLTYLDEN